VEEDHDGNERAQLFRVALDEPLTPEPLTEANPNYFIRGGALTPDGHHLVYGANVDVANGQEIEPTWVYRHDLATGARIPLARPIKGGHVDPELNATGTHILYTRQDLHPGGRQVWLVDIAGDHDEEILNVGDDRKAGASWFPDGRRAVVTADTPTHMRVGVWDLATRETRWLLDDPARTIEYAFVPYGSEQIVMLEIREARIHCSLLDPATGAETRLPAIPGNLTLLAPVGDGDWVGVYYSARQPTDLVRFTYSDPQPDAFVSLSRVWDRTALRPADLTPAEDFRWQSSDGLGMQGWLYRARETPCGTIVYVHGGPTGHSEDRINNQIQFFVHAGFNVLDPNYRGSTGFGIPFREAIKVGGWGSLEQEDIRAGIAALQAIGAAQPGKVGITGVSYGGFSSWFAITHFPVDIVAASAPVCGMTDLVVDYETTRPDLRPYSEEMMGGRPDQVPDRYFNGSPINFAQHIRGKLLIIQGDQDPNVTPENVRVVEETLRRHNIPYDKLTFPDEGHGVAKPRNQKTLYQRLLAFFSAM
jgi:dipeptidyl aminopeptidase/acylaminoacyl peptidase